MCGIAGYTHYQRRTDAARIRRATLALTHRGPDQHGFYESESVSLGAVRLRIIDLEGGDQPMKSADGDTTLVFNGEIYNNTELREELRQRGHSFRTLCDTETVLHAFLEWDTDCFQRLRGMFALALWCESENRLVLARDRIGIKPLYLHRRGINLYFGSELKALFAHPEIERKIDPLGLHYFTSLNYVPCPNTLVEGIEKLPPGHFLEWRAGRVETAEYWKLSFRPQRHYTLDSAAEELHQLLDDSVREHLISDVPLGLWASGGLDSSTILHYASAHSSSRVKTFSVSFAGRSFDEGEHARRVASHYGTDHYEFDLNPDVDLDSAIESLAYYSDEPGADAGALPVWFLSKLSREHVTVALSGEGADELFGGYNTYLGDRYARTLRHVPALARRVALKLARRLPASNEKIGFDYKVQRMLQGSFLNPGEAHLFWNGTFSEVEKKKLHLRNGHPSVGSLLDHLPAHSRNVGYLNRYLWLDQRYYLPDDILYKCDRMSMAHSVEVRPPFLDHRIVEFAARLPENLKIRNNSLKVVLRHLMRDKLPPQVLARRKEGFDIPAHDWLRGVLRPLLLDTLTRDAVEKSNLFDWNVVDRLIHTHLNRHANLGYHLWGLLTLFLWMKRWDVQSDPTEEEHPTLSAVSATS
ncbi:MAG TPA: asparagine synthase (glutamine-hydrolyzing) [Bryobacteraceae bacterium]|nr:asparagine synthase (glutamine-hydrolyzing) [Bryobacteraceae bacterium]